MTYVIKHRAYSKNDVLTSGFHYSDDPSVVSVAKLESREAIPSPAMSHRYTAMSHRYTAVSHRYKNYLHGIAKKRRVPYI